MENWRLKMNLKHMKLYLQRIEDCCNKGEIELAKNLIVGIGMDIALIENDLQKHGNNAICCLCGSSVYCEKCADNDDLKSFRKELKIRKAGKVTANEILRRIATSAKSDEEIEEFFGIPPTFPRFNCAGKVIIDELEGGITRRAADGAIVCPGCGELKIEETVHCTRCGTFLPRR